MQDLRLIGVHEDGQHLLLADSEGGRYRLPLDEALRAAARRDRPRLGQLQIEIEGGLRPRDVQALLRRGLSTEEVADRAGWSVEKVQRFESPILAEREHVARQAQATVVDSRGLDAREPITLGDRIATRLKDRDVDLDTVVWDSARVDDGTWRVHQHFVAGGRERTATWRFDPALGAVSPLNDEARWLGEDDHGVSLPAPHVATTNNRLETVFDVDAPTARGNRASERQAAELASSMRAGRQAGGRSRRRSASPSHTPLTDAPREDALPLEQLPGDIDDADEPPAARGYHEVSAHLDERADPGPADLPDVAPPPTGVSRTLRAVPAIVTAAPEGSGDGDVEPEDPAGLAPTDDADESAPEGGDLGDAEADDAVGERTGAAEADADAGPVGTQIGDSALDETVVDGEPVDGPAAVDSEPVDTAAGESESAETDDTALDETAVDDTLPIDPVSDRTTAGPTDAPTADTGADDVTEPLPAVDAGQPADDDDTSERPAQRRRNRRGRKSVPSWDDIMFGGRSGGGEDR